MAFQWTGLGTTMPQIKITSIWVFRKKKKTKTRKAEGTKDKQALQFHLSQRHFWNDWEGVSVTYLQESSWINTKVPLWTGQDTCNISCGVHQLLTGTQKLKVRKRSTPWICMPMSIDTHDIHIHTHLYSFTHTPQTHTARTCKDLCQSNEQFPFTDSVLHTQL